MIEAFAFEPAALPASAQGLRAEVRAFLADAMADFKPVERVPSWFGFDAGFSRKVGAAGYIGMAWSKAYGGHERGALERYVVLEELLAAGAPVGAHWVADRQSAPLLLRHASERQKQDIVPRIARGEVSFAIGMSEPDSGSDLASVRTRAIRTDDGWLVNGSKIWTSNAHHCDYMIALFRSDPESERHEGLSQFLVDLKATPGIQARPIRSLDGGAHFNEVVFQDAMLAPDALLGEEGGGWRQVVGELAMERSGPERFLSSMQLVHEIVRAASQDPDRATAAAIGRIVAHLATLRQMSLSIAAKLDRGEDTGLEASVVKDLGGVFEQEIPDIAQRLFEIEPSRLNGGDLAQVMALTTVLAPSFSLRGGTREILRGIIARGLGLR